MTNKPTYTRTCLRVPSHTFTLAHTHTHPRLQTAIHKAHPLTQNQRNTQALIHLTGLCTHSLTPCLTPIHTRTHTHTHPNRQVHTKTHTCTQLLAHTYAKISHHMYIQEPLWGVVDVPTTQTMLEGARTSDEGDLYIVCDGREYEVPCVCASDLH